MNSMPKIVVLLESGRSFDRQLLQGIGQYSRLHGPWTFHIVSEGLDRQTPPARLWNGAGVIARLNSRRIVRAVSAARIPFVAVESSWLPSSVLFNRRSASLFVDLEGVLKIAAEHLSSRGFRQFAFVGQPNLDWSDRTNRSVVDALARTQHPVIICPLKTSGALTWQQERNLLAQWLERLPKPIGIVACDDECGLQILAACRTARINVPNDVAVIGVGDDELLCALADPPLTSIGLKAVNGGYQAAHALDCLMQRLEKTAQQLLIEPSGVTVRSSTDIDVDVDPHVVAARDAIRRQRLQELSIDGLAKTVGISRRALEVKFRKHTGRTILAEIQDCRLTRAKMILRETELPIAQVAYLCGYRSVSYLVQVFGREIGVTPAKYRLTSRTSGSSATPGDSQLESQAAARGAL